MEDSLTKLFKDLLSDFEESEQMLLDEILYGNERKKGYKDLKQKIQNYKGRFKNLAYNKKGGSICQ